MPEIGANSKIIKKTPFRTPATAPHTRFLLFLGSGSSSSDTVTTASSAPSTPFKTSIASSASSLLAFSSADSSEAFPSATCFLALCFLTP